VLNVSDSHKLWEIPDGKRVIVEFTCSCQPVGKKGGKWRCMTGKMVKSGAFVSDIRRLEEGTIREEEAIL
jgi:hypothetical protein